MGSDLGYDLFSPAETTLVGASGLHTRLGDGVREIGYWIHKDHINPGLATESSAALIKVAFVIDHVHRVEIHCDPKNVRSASIPRKLGYIHEVTFHDRVEDSMGNLHDSIVWSLFAEDYPARLSSQAQNDAYDGIGWRII